MGGRWQDYTAVFIKDSAEIERFPARILDRKNDFENGQRYGAPNCSTKRKFVRMTGSLMRLVLLPQIR
jgi:hypothetical protein